MKENEKKPIKGTKKKLTKKQTTLIVLCSVLSLVLVLLILGTAYMESLLGLLNKDVDSSQMSADEYEKFLQEQATETVDPNAVVIDPDDVNWKDVELLEKDDDIVNILLIGQDRRPGESRQRSDAMILCTINKSQKTLTMTSFMRDMYVQIPGYRDNRINACYQIGGMELLNACLEKNFGIQVDGNIEVDFDGFMEVIDLIGGVSIQLTSAEAGHLNGNHGYNLHEGENILNGEQALHYSRIRYIGNGDFGRTNRQRTVMSALINECKDLSLSQLNELVKNILPLVTTDMTNSEIVDYTLSLFPMLSGLEIDTQRIPADGAYQYATVKGMSVLVPDLEANRQLLSEIMSE